MKQYLIAFTLISNVYTINQGRSIPAGVQVMLNNAYETDVIEKAIISQIREVFPEYRRYNDYFIEIYYSVIQNNSIINTGNLKIKGDMI
jgi:hypothetical protein